MLCEEIGKLLNNSLNDMSETLYKNVQEKAINNLKAYPKDKAKKTDNLKIQKNKEKVQHNQKQSEVNKKKEQEGKKLKKKKLAKF